MKQTTTATTVLGCRCCCNYTVPQDEYENECGTVPDRAAMKRKRTVEYQSMMCMHKIS